MWILIFLLSVVIGLTLLLTICHYTTKKRKFWLYRNVPYREPCPIFGNFGATFTMRKSYTKMLQYFYDSYTKHKYVGIFQARRPTLMITDLEIVKNVFRREFANFSDRTSVSTDTRREPLLRNLSNMSGAEWRAMRQIVTPTFSSAKMKAMFPLIADCANTLQDILQHEATNVVNVPKLSSRFMTDVIGSCAFGVNPGSLQNAKSPFLIMSQKMFKVNASTILRRYCRSFFPRIFKLLNLRTYSAEVEIFFTSIISQVLTERRRTGEQREDFLQLMMNQKKNDTDLIITDELITSNSFIFMLAGLESSSITLSFCLYELAKRNELQENIRNEIRQCIENFNGLNYEAVCAMKLLSRSVLETLRLHPPTPMTTRLCTAPCRLPGTDVNLQVKDAIIVPLQSIQNDPQHFPEPDKFDPDRFNGDSSPSGFLAFGDGPRSCPGNYVVVYEFTTINKELGLLVI